MAKEHEWEFDAEQSMDMNAKCSFHVMSGQFFINRCKSCGCIRITDSSKSFMDEKYHVYKPAGWNWNPFKVLKDEPSCPAEW